MYAKIDPDQLLNCDYFTPEHLSNESIKNCINTGFICGDIVEIFVKINENICMDELSEYQEKRKKEIENLSDKEKHEYFMNKRELRKQKRLLESKENSWNYFNINIDYDTNYESPGACAFNKNEDIFSDYDNGKMIDSDCEFDKECRDFYNIGKLAYYGLGMYHKMYSIQFLYTKVYVRYIFDCKIYDEWIATSSRDTVRCDEGIPECVTKPTTSESQGHIIKEPGVYGFNPDYLGHRVTPLQSCIRLGPSLFSNNIGNSDWDWYCNFPQFPMCYNDAFLMNKIKDNNLQDFYNYSENNNVFYYCSGTDINNNNDHKGIKNDEHQPLEQQPKLYDLKMIEDEIKSKKGEHGILDDALSFIFGANYESNYFFNTMRSMVFSTNYKQMKNNQSSLSNTMGSKQTAHRSSGSREISTDLGLAGAGGGSGGKVENNDSFMNINQMIIGRAKSYAHYIGDYLFDYSILSQIWTYFHRFTALISTNLIGIIGLVLSFGSYMVHLGLDFMVFLASLFYLLLDSDSLLEQIKNILSFIPSTAALSTLTTPMVSLDILPLKETATPMLKTRSPGRSILRQRGTGGRNNINNKHDHVTFVSLSGGDKHYMYDQSMGFNSGHNTVNSVNTVNNVRCTNTRLFS